jgi:hypothetical protein
MSDLPYNLALQSALRRHLSEQKRMSYFIGIDGGGGNPNVVGARAGRACRLRTAILTHYSDNAVSG